MDNCKEHCRLCLVSLHDKNYDIIEDVTKNMLNALLLKLNIVNEKPQFICNVCSAKLHSAVEFKTKCLSVDNTIISCVNFDKSSPSPVDLTEIFTKQNGIVCDEKVCRLCMQIVDDPVAVHEANAELCRRFIPEVSFNTTKDAAICSLCLDALITHNNFIKQCFEVEKMFVDEADVPNIDLSIIKCEKDSWIVKTEQFDFYGNDERRNQENLAKVETVEVKPEYVEIEEEQEKSVQFDSKPSTNNSPKTKHLTCYLCDYNTVCKKTMKTHMSTHRDPSSPDMFKCELCGYHTKYLKTIKNHSITHRNPTDVQWFQCRACDFRSKWDSALKRHVLIHKNPTEIEWYRCRTCQFKTKRKRSLDEHVVTHLDPSEIQWYECEVCVYRTKRKKDLRQHRLVHCDPTELALRESRAVWFDCTVCDYKTKRKVYLKRHMVVHCDVSEIEWFECARCEYRSKRKDDLRKHMLNHKDSSEIPWFKCHLCGYTTKRKENLKRHVFTHKKVEL